MRDCKFYVNEEKRVVVCVINTTEDKLADDIWSITHTFNPYDFPCLEMKNRFVGRATCSPDDEWNTETGKLLAYKRAKHNFYTSYFKHLNKFVNAIEDELDSIEAKFDKFGENLSKNFKQTDETIKGIIGTEA